MGDAKDDTGTGTRRYRSRGSVQRSKVEYDVLFNKSLIQLILDVNQRLKEGWELHGSFAVDTDHESDVKYFQPLVWHG